MSCYYLFFFLNIISYLNSFHSYLISFLFYFYFLILFIFSSCLFPFFIYWTYFGGPCWAQWQPNSKSNIQPSFSSIPSQTIGPNRFFFFPRAIPPFAPSFHMHARPFWTLAYLAPSMPLPTAETPKIPTQRYHSFVLWGRGQRAAGWINAVILRSQRHSSGSLSISCWPTYSWFCGWFCQIIWISTC